MSTTDGDASSRLDDVIAGVLSGTPRLPGDTSAVPPADDWSVDGPDDDQYFLPEIVPATVQAPVPPASPDPGLAAVPAPTAPVSHTPAPATVPTAPAAAPKVAPAPAPPARPAATAWSDHMTSVPASGSTLRAPGRRPRVRRVTRVLRHIDPWSTFKVALLFSGVAYLVTLTAGVLLWRVADSTGTLDNVERWFTQFGWETFELKGGEIFRNAWIIGLFGAVALTGGLVLLATLFNLVSDIVGGVRMTVLEEEVVERTVTSTRRYVVRRPPTGSADSTDWDIDDDTAPESSDPPGDPETTSNPAVPAADAWSVDDEDDDQDPQSAG